MRVVWALGRWLAAWLDGAAGNVEIDASERDPAALVPLSRSSRSFARPKRALPPGHMEIAPIETPASSSSTDGEAGACLPDLSAETARTPRKRLAWNPSLVDSTGPPSALELWEWQNPQELASIFVPHEEIELARLEARVERCQDPRRSALRRRGRESTEGYGSARHAIAAAAAAARSAVTFEAADGDNLKQAASGVLPESVQPAKYLQAYTDKMTEERAAVASAQKQVGELTL